MCAHVVLDPACEHSSYHILHTHNDVVLPEELHKSPNAQCIPSCAHKFSHTKHTQSPSFLLLDETSYAHLNVPSSHMNYHTGHTGTSPFHCGDDGVP